MITSISLSDFAELSKPLAISILISIDAMDQTEILMTFIPGGLSSVHRINSVVGGICKLGNDC